MARCAGPIWKLVGRFLPLALAGIWALAFFARLTAVALEADPSSPSWAEDSLSEDQVEIRWGQEGTLFESATPQEVQSRRLMERAHVRKRLPQFWSAALMAFVVAVAVSLLLGQRKLEKAWAGDGLGDYADSAPEEWRRLFAMESYEQNIRAGAGTLFAFVCGMIFQQAMEFLLTTGISEFQCAHPWGWWFGLFRVTIESGVLVAVSIYSFRCMHLPRDTDFWPCLLFMFFYMPARFLPPFHWSCTDLSFPCWSEFHNSQVVKESILHMDCTMSGHTTICCLITWVLSLPWIIPVPGLVPLVQIWLYLVFLGWSIMWRKITNEYIFALQDIMLRFLLLAMALFVAQQKSVRKQKSMWLRFSFKMRDRLASKKMFRILKYMVPMHVIVPMLKNPGGVVAKQVNRVSIMFIVIEDFESYAYKKTPGQLLLFLNRQFSKIDKICTRNKVTKIETVCEEYVCCVGVSPTDEAETENEGHSRAVGRLFCTASQIMCLQEGGEAMFKMGAHSGPVVAGIVGTKLPRYRLVGDTINTAARMMQKGEKGKLQFGEETRKDLPASIKVSLRGDVEMKGKGRVRAFVFEDRTLETISTASHTSSLSHPSSLKNTLLSNGADSSSNSPRIRGVLGHRLQRPRARTGATSAGGDIEMQAMSSPNRGTTSSNLAFASDVMLDDEEEADFEHVIEQVSKERETSKSQRCFMPERAAFTAQMEEEWLVGHHREAHKSGVKLLGREAIALLLVSMFEAPRLWYNRVWTESFEEGWPKGSRLYVWAACRAAALLILLSKWHFATASQELVERRPALVHRLFLAGNGIVSMLLFISYDAMMVSTMTSARLAQLPDGRYVGAEGFEGNENLMLATRGGVQSTDVDGEVRILSLSSGDQLYTIIFVLAYFFLIRQQGMLFFPSLIFVGLAVIMMLAHFVYIPTSDGLYLRLGVLFYTSASRVFFVVNALLNCYLSYEIEVNSRVEYMTKHAQIETMQRVNLILDTLLPPLVVKKLRSLEPGVAHKPDEYRHATIAQSDLCGFTKLASTRGPKEVVQLIGKLFGLFDDLSTKHQVYKVETVGDAYIAGMAEPPLTEKNSPKAVIIFGIGMVKEVHRWSKANGFEITCRVGIHYGECIGGIVGNDMQRYHLFGRLMNGVEILESTAPQGRVQVSKACKEEVERQLAEEEISCPEIKGFTMRKERHLQTSKGEIHEYSDIGGKTYIVEVGV